MASKSKARTEEVPTSKERMNGGSASNGLRSVDDAITSYLCAHFLASTLYSRAIVAHDGPGGQPLALNADALRVERKAQAFVEKMNREDKPFAVICHAPWLLVSTRLVNGRTMTSYYTIQDDIRNAGGKWVDQEVVRDRNWISSRGPKDIPVFNQAMIALFAEHKSPAMGQQRAQ